MPFLFRQGHEAKQLQHILAHQQIGIKRHNLARPGQRRQGAFRTEHQISDATHINQHVIRGAILKPARDLANHAVAFAIAAPKPAAPP